MWNIYHKPTGEFEHSFSLLCTKKKKQFKRILTLINCFIHQKLIFGVPMKSSDYFFAELYPQQILLANHGFINCVILQIEKKKKKKVFQNEIQVIIFTHCPHHTYLYKHTHTHTHTRSLSLSLSISLFIQSAIWWQPTPPPPPPQVVQSNECD